MGAHAHHSQCGARDGGIVQLQVQPGAKVSGAGDRSMVSRKRPEHRSRPAIVEGGRK